MKNVSDSLHSAFEGQKKVQIKIKHTAETWCGWIRSENQSPDSSFWIYEFERVLNESENKDETPLNTVNQKIPSFWIEDVTTLE